MTCKQPTPVPAGAIKPAPLPAPPLRSEPVYGHEDCAIPLAGAGAAALNALRRFPRLAKGTEEWTFTTAAWQTCVIDWWREIAQPILGELDKDPPTASGAVTFGYDRGTKIGDRTIVRCGYCGFTSSSVDEINDHECPGSEPAGGFICGACGFSSTTPEEMLEHKCPHAPPADK